MNEHIVEKLFRKDTELKVKQWWAFLAYQSRSHFHLIFSLHSEIFTRSGILDPILKILH